MNSPSHSRRTVTAPSVSVLFLLVLLATFAGATLHDALVERAILGQVRLDAKGDATDDSDSVSDRRARGDEVFANARPLSTIKFIDVQPSSFGEPSDATDARAGALAGVGCAAYASEYSPSRLKADLSQRTEEAMNRDRPTQTAIMHKVTMWNDATLGHPGRILCAAYTHDKKHDAVLLMRRSWGKRCDRHIIFTNNADDPTLKEVPPEDIVKLSPRGGESYYNMWQKTREAFLYLSAQPWVHDFEYFFFGGDDAFLVPENLRKLLLNPEVAFMHESGAPLFIGYRQRIRQYDSKNRALPIKDEDTVTAFLSGAGYVMNAAALQLAGVLVRHSPHCSPDLHASHEDVYLANCLRFAGVDSSDTRDHFGEDRFIILSNAHMMYQAENQDYSWWWRDYRDRQMPMGLDIVARDTILFHYMDPGLTKQFAEHLYGAGSSSRRKTKKGVVAADNAPLEPLLGETE
jgi:hypothetical protein